MPIYEYRRPDGTTFEVMQKMSDPALTHDPETGEPVERVFTPVAIHFKGKGFHNTDYGTRKRNREKAAREVARATSSSSSSSDGGSTSRRRSPSSSKTSDPRQQSWRPSQCRQLVVRPAPLPVSREVWGWNAAPARTCGDRLAVEELLDARAA